MPKAFKFLTLSRLLMAFAVQMQAVLLGWQIYEIKKEAIFLGYTGLIEAVPALCLALFAGVIVDKKDPRRVFQFVIVMSFISALVLWSVTLARLLRPGIMTDDLAVILLYFGAFLTGVGRGFGSPALYALVPKIIDRTLFNKSSAWMGGVYQGAMVVGPAVGGLLYAWAGNPMFAYSFELLLLVSCFLLFSNIKEIQNFNRNISVEKSDFIKAEVEPIGQAIMHGVRFVFGHPLLFGALVLDMFAVLFGGVTAILPIFADQILHSGPESLGLLRASPAIGAVIMSLYLANQPIGKGAGKILLSVVFGFGLCMLGFAASRSFLACAILLFFSGALDSVSMVIRGTIVQMSSPEKMRGRIAAVNSIFIGSSNELGAFESGVAAQLFGLVPSIYIGGTLTLVVVSIIAIKFPKLRNLNLKEL